MSIARYALRHSTLAPFKECMCQHTSSNVATCYYYISCLLTHRCAPRKMGVASLWLVVQNMCICASIHAITSCPFIVWRVAMLDSQYEIRYSVCLWAWYQTYVRLTYLFACMSCITTLAWRVCLTGKDNLVVMYCFVRFATERICMPVSPLSQKSWWFRSAFGS